MAICSVSFLSLSFSRLNTPASHPGFLLSPSSRLLCFLCAFCSSTLPFFFFPSQKPVLLSCRISSLISNRHCASMTHDFSPGFLSSFSRIILVFVDERDFMGMILYVSVFQFCLSRKFCRLYFLNHSFRTFFFNLNVPKYRFAMIKKVQLTLFIVYVVRSSLSKTDFKLMPNLPVAIVCVQDYWIIRGIFRVPFSYVTYDRYRFTLACYYLWSLWYAMRLCKRTLCNTQSKPGWLLQLLPWVINICIVDELWTNNP